MCSGFSSCTQRPFFFFSSLGEEKEQRSLSMNLFFCDSENPVLETGDKTRCVCVFEHICVCAGWNIVVVD